MSCLAIIPARGGSRGVPRKNVAPLLGRPMLVYTIEQARGTPEISRIVVSTDDPAIARVAEENGAETVMRPDEISGDTASSESALLHVLDHLRDIEGYEPRLVVFLQATSPLRRPDDIARAIHTLEDAGADSLFSATHVHGFVWRQVDGQPASFSYDFRNRPRRQDAPEDLVENGSIYVFRPWVLRHFNNRLGGRIAVYRMPAVTSLQVDEPSDLALMEALLSTVRTTPAAVDLARVSLLVLDFDGVMTDNRVSVDERGVESAACHRGDGWGIARLVERGVEVVVVSTEENPVVTARCRKLRIPCIQGSTDKLSAVRQLATERGLEPGAVAYVGNDVNDLGALRWVGLPIAVADAEPEVRAASRLVTSNAGGNGAVREVAEWLLAARAMEVTADHLSAAITPPGGAR